MTNMQRGEEDDNHRDIKVEMIPATVDDVKPQLLQT